MENKKRKLMNNKPIYIPDTVELYNMDTWETVPNRNGKRFKKNIVSLAFVYIVVLTSVLSMSYALYTADLTPESNYTMTVGNLDFKIENESNSITLMNAYPMTDEEGKNLTPYKFTIHNTGDMNSNFSVSIVDDANEKVNCINCKYIEKNKVKVELKENGVSVFGPTLLSEFDETMLTGKLDIDETNNYEIRLWLDYDNTILSDAGKYYFGKIRVTLTQEAE